jgi:hypothetical protein
MEEFYKNLRALGCKDKGRSIFKIFRVAKKVNFISELSKSYNFLDLHNDDQIEKFLDILLLVRFFQFEDFCKEPTKLNFIQFVTRELLYRSRSNEMYELFISYFAFLEDYPSLEVTEFDSDLNLLGAYVAVRHLWGKDIDRQEESQSYLFDDFSKSVFNRKGKSEEAIELFTKTVDYFLNNPLRTSEQIKEFIFYLENLRNRLIDYLGAHFKLEALSIFKNRGRLFLLRHVVETCLKQIDVWLQKGKSSD